MENMLSSFFIGNFFCTIISPASNFSSMNCIVTPPILSLLNKYQKYCAAPLYLGRSDPWAFNEPHLATEIIGFLSIWLTKQNRQISGFRIFTCLINSGSLTSFAFIMFMPYFFAFFIILLPPNDSYI